MCDDIDSEIKISLTDLRRRDSIRMVQKLERKTALAHVVVIIFKNRKHFNCVAANIFDAKIVIHIVIK